MLKHLARDEHVKTARGLWDVEAFDICVVGPITCSLRHVCCVREKFHPDVQAALTLLFCIGSGRPIAASDFQDCAVGVDPEPINEILPHPGEIALTLVRGDPRTRAKANP